eukprot:3646674-Rhodomonas_salina.1
MLVQNAPEIVTVTLAVPGYVAKPALLPLLDRSKGLHTRGTPGSVKRCWAAQQRSSVFQIRPLYHGARYPGTRVPREFPVPSIPVSGQFKLTVGSQSLTAPQQQQRSSAGFCGGGKWELGESPKNHRK